MSEQPLSESDLSEIEARWVHPCQDLDQDCDNICSDGQDDVTRLIAALRRARAENEKLKQTGAHKEREMGVEVGTRRVYAMNDFPHPGTLLVIAEFGYEDSLAAVEMDAQRTNQTLFGVSIKPIKSGEQLVKGEHYVVEGRANSAPRTGDDVVRDGRSAILWAEIDAMYAKIMGDAPRLRVGQRVRVKAGYRRTIIALGWKGEALETFPNDGEIIIIKEIVGTNIVADHGSVVPLEFVEAVD